MRRLSAILVFAVGATAPMWLANAPTTDAGAPPPAADPKDVRSIDAIIKATYASMSGVAGEKRDWDRFRSLFHPEGRLAPVVQRRDGKARPAITTPGAFAKRNGPMFTKVGFSEKEVARRTERFRHLAHVWSTYEARRADQPDVVWATGLNSFQLVFDSQRWWILHLTWTPADKNNPVPDKYRK
ncbi:MAG: hypothetical protein CMJ83_18320 [Planctomycetes bacterium]|nr:hypothetical protein [Planctomycetota bacterium]